VIESALDSWAKCGVPRKDKSKIQDHIATVLILRERGMQGPSIIMAYH
jgi:hypothetical protein